MHKKGVFHRDLKLENILLKKLKPKITDFGWCCMNCLNEDRKTYCGTPAYIPPEMRIGIEHDNKVDVWAFGVLLYELAYNKIPISFSKEGNKKIPLKK